MDLGATLIVISLILTVIFTTYQIGKAVAERRVAKEAEERMREVEVRLRAIDERAGLVINGIRKDFEKIHKKTFAERARLLLSRRAS